MMSQTPAPASAATILESEGVVCAVLRNGDEPTQLFRSLVRREGGGNRVAEGGVKQVEDKYFGERARMVKVVEKARVRLGWGVGTWARAVRLMDVVISQNGVGVKEELPVLALVCLWISAKHTENGGKTCVTAQKVASAAGYHIRNPRKFLDMEQKVLNYACCELRTPDPLTALHSALPCLIAYTTSQPPALCSYDTPPPTITITVNQEPHRVDIDTPIENLPVLGKHLYHVTEVGGMKVCAKVHGGTPRSLCWGEGEELFSCDDLRKSFVVATRRYEMGLAVEHHREMIHRGEDLVKECVSVAEMGLVLSGTEVALMSLCVAWESIVGRDQAKPLSEFLSKMLPKESPCSLEGLVSKYRYTPTLQQCLSMYCVHTPQTDSLSDALSSSVVSWHTVSPTPEAPIAPQVAKKQCEQQHLPVVAQSTRRKWGSFFTKKSSSSAAAASTGDF